MNTTLMGKHLPAGCLPNAVQPALYFGLHAVLHAVMPRIAIYSVSLLCMLAIHPTIAAEAGAGEYQSSFNGYKPMTADSPEDWNATNQRVTAEDRSSASTDHSQHSMHHEALVQKAVIQKAVIQQAGVQQVIVQPSQTAESGEDMAGMDHGEMEQTDHSSMHRDQIHREQMHHDHTMSPMPAVEHNDKAGVSHAH